MSDARAALAAKCDELKDLLLRKNQAYGNSAMEPVRIFSTADPVEQLKVRLDDKLSRLSKGVNTERVPEDTLMDICGYLILLMVAQAPETCTHQWVHVTEIDDISSVLECTICTDVSIEPHSIPYLDN